MVESENKKLILVVDDHPKVLAFIAIDLKLRGFDVICAESGPAALELVKTKKPDLILLDILMPGMSGFEVLEKLRAFSDVPVIAFSASPENKAPALRAGANDFMPKPFDSDDMAARIALVLG